MDTQDKQEAHAVGENIAAIRKRQGLSQEEFAALVGVSQGTISAWENGEASPRRNSVSRILEAIPDLVADDICSVEYGFARRLDKVGRVSPVETVPLYGTISAGVPLNMLPVDDYVAVPREVRKRFPHAFFLRVRGNSMNRVLPNGCLALVNPTNDLEDGAVYAVCVGDTDATVKRVRTTSTTLDLLPDSYDLGFESMHFDLSNPFDTPRILGRVVWFTMPVDFTL